MGKIKLLFTALTISLCSTITYAQLGSLDLSFDPGTGASSAVRTTSIQSDGKIIISGIFTDYDGMARNYIARLEGTTVGIPQLINEINNVVIFPNPFSTATTLHSEVELKNAELTVSSSTGQSVKQISNISGNTIILNRDNLPTGLHFVRLSQDDQVIMSDKLVIAD